MTVEVIDINFLSFSTVVALGHHILLPTISFGLGAIIGPILIVLAFSGGMSWRTVLQVIDVLLTLLTVAFVAANACFVVQ